jgi:hypothetical protein
LARAGFRAAERPGFRAAERPGFRAAERAGFRAAEFLARAREGWAVGDGPAAASFASGGSADVGVPVNGFAAVGSGAPRLAGRPSAGEVSRLAGGAVSAGAGPARSGTTAALDAALATAGSDSVAEDSVGEGSVAEDSVGEGSVAEGSAGAGRAEVAARRWIAGGRSVAKRMCRGTRASRSSGGLVGSSPPVAAGVSPEASASGSPRSGTAEASGSCSGAGA